MKLNLKSLVMMLMAATLCFSVVSCSDDDDDDNKVYSNSIGEIVDNGDQVVATSKFSYDDDGFTVSCTEQYILTFKDGKCTGAIEKDTYSPSEYAKDMYDYYCEDWEEDFKEKPTINGSTITCILLDDDFVGCSKDEIIEILKNLLDDEELGDDEE